MLAIGESGKQFISVHFIILSIYLPPPHLSLNLKNSRQKAGRKTKLHILWNWTDSKVYLAGKICKESQENLKKNNEGEWVLLDMKTTPKAIVI